MIYDGTGSVEGGSGWCLVVLGQWEAVLVGTWWYWVSKNLRNAKNKICKNTDDAHSEAYEHTAYVLAAERKFLNS